eukprot:2815272-Alexandrium_andersonii.AAC.1
MCRWCHAVDGQDWARCDLLGRLEAMGCRRLASHSWSVLRRPMTQSSPPLSYGPLRATPPCSSPRLRDSSTR